jgi:hypothetical protein
VCVGGEVSGGVVPLAVGAVGTCAKGVGHGKWYDELPWVVVSSVTLAPSEPGVVLAVGPLLLF